MIRRTLMAALVASAGLSLMVHAAGSPDTVKVEGGVVSGTATDGVRVFRGIPYAAPPVGELRWRPPAPVVPWTGVRDASAYGAECPQTQYPADSVYVRPLRTRSEDCLFLNVWTTAKAGDKRPVFVWVHGGALTRGSSTSDVRDGSPMAKRGPVVVSLNYRLGALGYMAHPELTAESPQHSSGNYGVLDQVAALKWVQKNIAAFGGDPSKVTIGGESAGSWSVNTLVATPLARGLFIRAIGESGGRFTGTPHLHDDAAGTSAENVGLALARTVGASSLKELRALPAEKLLDVRGFRTEENVDGWVLPEEIRAIFAEKKENPGPVLIGSNANEMTSLGGGAGRGRASAGDFHARIAQTYGDMAKGFESAYNVDSEADYAEALLAVGRNTTFSLHMRAWARATVDANSRAYLYLFSHVPPSPRAKELRAFHASELPYVFNVLHFGDPREAGFAYTAVDDKLADEMSSYWANFVTSGDPNGKGLAKWTAYDLKDEPFMEFGDVPHAGTHLFKAQLDFLEAWIAARPR
jgi:para-nitrobenzyl esterase